MTELTPEENHKMWLPQTIVLGWLFSTALFIVIPLYLLVMSHLIPTQSSIWYYDLIVPYLRSGYTIFIITFIGGLISAIINVRRYWKSANTSEELKSLVPEWSAIIQILWMSLFSILQMSLLSVMTTLFLNWTELPIGFWDHILASVLPWVVPGTFSLYILGMMIVMIVISCKRYRLTREQKTNDRIFG